MRYTVNQWNTIRDEWEYSPEQPSFTEAGERAATKHGFKRPAKQTIQARAKAQGWQRKGAPLEVVNASAHLLADNLMETDGGPDGIDTKKRNEYRDESEAKRAEIRARHRGEWQQVSELRDEALGMRTSNPDSAFHALKIAKITAEITALQQAGETRAWQLDAYISPEQLRQMSDENLAAVAAGKLPYR